MSDTNRRETIRYQRGRTIINGTTKHDIRLKYIDLIGSKLIKLAMIPGIPAGIYKILIYLLDKYG
jgi:hypothetical protein